MSGASGVRFRAGLVALLVLIAGLMPVVADSARAQTTSDPLSITIDAMSTDSTSGDVHLSGHISNNDDQTWRDVNILPCLSSTPIGTVADLQTATQTVANAVVCKRDPRAFSIIKQLLPGATTTWTLTVPSALLPQAYAGVYWFGVHALGTSDAGVSVNADGRARMFLPVVSQAATPAKVNVIVEFSEQIGYDSLGHLMETTSSASGAPAWADEFRGHLNHLLTVVARTPGAGMLVDPALIDAASRLADGNTGWLGDTGTLADTKAAAAAWLSAFKAVARSHQVWALPYGDLDVAATADRPDIATTAEGLALAPLQAIGVRADLVRRSQDLSVSEAVVGGPSGSIAFADGQVVGPLAVSGGVRVVGTALASFGAPAPGDPYAAIPLRQQILSEAALRAGTATPVVVIIPAKFAATDPIAFATGLAAPWVSLVSLADALSGTTARAYPKQPPTGPESSTVHGSVMAYDSAVAAAFTLHSMTDIDEGGVIRAALAGLSGGAIRGSTTQDVNSGVNGLIQQVTVTAPPGVSLSGSTGRFSIGLDNRLAVPVTVGIRAITDENTSIGRFGTVTLPPHGSGTMLATVSVNAHGTHRVIFSVTDASGHDTGRTADVAVRSVQVSGVIWAFIAGGVGLLGFAIAMRLIRRVRNRS